MINDSNNIGKYTNNNKNINSNFNIKTNSEFSMFGKGVKNSVNPMSYFM